MVLKLLIGAPANKNECFTRVYVEKIVYLFETYLMGILNTFIKSKVWDLFFYSFSTFIRFYVEIDFGLEKVYVCTIQ